MQFILAILPILAAFAPASSAPVESPFMGTIEAPTANAPVVPAAAIPFSYTVVNWCEEGYNNFNVFLTNGAEAPTIEDVDSTGNIASALHSFGTFTVANFGLPPTGTSPPAELTVPADISSDAPVYVTVVETFNGCPGHVVQEIGITSVPVNMS